MGRLAGKVAVVIGAGQSPGQGMGNGRAVALRFAEEGARVLCVDRDLSSAKETADLAKGEAAAFAADVMDGASLGAAVADAKARFGRLDILHYNVGVSLAGGDTVLAEVSEEAFDRVHAINLRGAVMAAKHAVPSLRSPRSRRRTASSPTARARRL